MSPEQDQTGPEKESVSYQPLTLNQPQAALIKGLWWGNSVCFALLTVGAAALASWQSALGVVVGGLIALVNFRLLERTIGRALRPQPAPAVSPLRRVLTSYYLRLAVTAVVLLVLVRARLVEPLGLLAGLSVVVLSILVWGAMQARRFWQGRE